MTSLEKSIETTGKSEVKVLKLPRLKVIRLKRALKAFFPVDTTDFADDRRFTCFPIVPDSDRADISGRSNSPSMTPF